MTHFQKRCAQRNLNERDIRFVRLYGSIYHKTGALIYFLGRKDLPTSLRHDDRYSRLEGTVLIEYAGGDSVTAYRNRNSLRKIRCKPKHRRGPRTTGTLGIEIQEKNLNELAQ
jgi:hypothetical protein